MPDVGDEVADDEGLALGVGEDERVDEALPEHVGLELEGGVEDPEEAEDYLERALRAQDRRDVPIGAWLLGREGARVSVGIVCGGGAFAFVRRVHVHGITHNATGRIVPPRVGR